MKVDVIFNKAVTREKGKFSFLLQETISRGLTPLGTNVRFSTVTGHCAPESIVLLKKMPSVESVRVID